MRRLLALLPLTSLAACGGGGNGNLQTLNSTAITSPVAGTSTSTSAAHSFVAPTQEKTYAGIGGVHSFDYTTKETQGGQSGQLYRGHTDTVRNPTINVTYDPRSALFSLKITDSAGGVTTETGFQDPAHRTDFAGTSRPQAGVPDLGATIRYLQVGSFTGTPGTPGGVRDRTTFFYQAPGSSTKYVTYAGYVRSQITTTGETVNGVTVLGENLHLERGAFAYGELTPVAAVPKTGSATFSGSMLATMVNNPTLDSASSYPTYFQWISGTSKVDVNFASGAVGLAFNGTTTPVVLDNYSKPELAVVPGGASFAATGSATIDLIGKGGFTGGITSATISGVNAPVGTTGVSGTTQTLAIAGSSVDGAFYGPAAEEVGGGFRIVGGTPDQRIDILGTFTGAK